ncbi:MAG: NAD(P)-dependent oxidoreductase [Candidatus Eremiobacteraeota bacterium]|nr:NAD(P)-dependent oxidoreductase [Candidatus Eremiobacteraeota bacterium]
MILLTGSQGRVGRFLQPFLQAHGWQVRTTDLVEGADLCGNLRDEEFCRRCLDGIRFVVHAGARPDLQHADTYENNTQSTRALAVAAREAGVERFLFFSSICANGRSSFGTRRFLDPSRLPIDSRESDRPHDDYSLSKQVCETMLEGMSLTGRMATYCLRPCGLWFPEETRRYRPGPRPPRQNLNLVDPWLYLDMRDLAEAVRLALRVDLPVFGRAYLTAADTTRPEPSLLLLAYYFPGLLWRIRGNLWGHRSWFDCSQAYRDLGWKPQHSWRQEKAPES